MEHAILLNRIEDLKLVSVKYSRLYFGNEFCPHLMPSRSDINLLVQYIKKRKVLLTFLSPHADSQSIVLIKKIIRLLIGYKVLDEVVVNDYGVLYFVNKYFPEIKIICGRGLSRKVQLTNDSILYVKGIRRLEFDFDTQTSKNRTDISVSYYYPYSVIGATRYCAFANIKNSNNSNPGIRTCHKECLGLGEYFVSNPELLKQVILKGNSLFLSNDTGQPIKTDNIDRLVFQPKIPL